MHAVATPRTGLPLHCAENFIVTLRFADGSIGSLLYSSEGDSALGKERIEAFAAGQSVVVDDFRRLERYANGRRSTTKGRLDKGHRAEMRRFLAVLPRHRRCPGPGIGRRVDAGHPGGP